MSNVKKLMMTAAGGEPGPDVEEVFKPNYWFGNNSTRQVNNGIDLSTEGGMVWIKLLKDTYKHCIYDTERGVRNTLASNSNQSEYNEYATLQSFDTTGYTIGADFGVNQYTSYDYIGYTFRRCPKFFDVVSWSGTGTSSRQIAHNIGGNVGMVMVKKYNNSQSWHVLHRDMSAGKVMYLDQYYPASNDATAWDSTHATSTHFTVGASLNASGSNYVAYVFAHNNNDGGFGPEGADDIIKCGTYTGASPYPEINLGFEPQYILIKQDGYSNWIVFDSKRGICSNYYQSSNDSTKGTYYIEPNTTSVQYDFWDGAHGVDSLEVFANGFRLKSTQSLINSVNGTYHYMAIAKGPLYPPTSSDEVFDIHLENGYNYKPGYEASVDVDMGFEGTRSSGNYKIQNRKAQSVTMYTQNTNREDGGSLSGTNPAFTFDNGYGWAAYPNTAGFMWRSAPGYFDVATWSGDGSGTKQIPHNLKAVPEMIWTRARGASSNWYVYHSGKGINNSGLLDTDGGFFSSAALNTAPTDASITVNSFLNSSSNYYLAYLFGSVEGVSKCGTYVGQGTSTTINVDCGFSTGARLVIIKRMDGTGSWILIDKDRGLVTGYGDIHSNLDSNTAELSSYNVLDPYSPGFKVVGDPYPSYGSIMTSGATYVYYAVANP